MGRAGIGFLLRRRWRCWPCGWSFLVTTPLNLANLPTEEAIASPNTVRYEFRFEAGSAAEVCLAGDFNSWKVCDARLSRVGEDVWSVSLELPPGRYEYMFVVDGRWVTDPHAMGFHDDGFGNQNAILVL